MTERAAEVRGSKDPRVEGWMDLIVHITVMKQGEERFARIQLTNAEGGDGESSQTVSDERVELDAPTRAAAEYQAMLLAVLRTAETRPDSVEFRLTSKRMVDELTGVANVESESLMGWFDRVEAELLKLDTWRVCVRG